MQVTRRAALVALLVCVAPLGWTQERTIVRPEDLQRLLSTLNAVDAAEPLEIVQDDSGFVTFLGAPRGGEFSTPTSIAKSAVAAASVATSFAGTHGAAFGVRSGNVSFSPRVTHSRRAHDFVHLRQSYSDVEVFASDMVVQVNADGAIESVLSDILRDSASLDSGELSTTPTITAQAAIAAAIVYAQPALDDGVTVASVRDAQLLIYEPGIFGQPGATRLVWDTELESSVQGAYHRRIFVDAHTGDIVFEYSLIHEANDRRIYDANFNEVFRLNLRRSEGEPATGSAEVDAAYDFVGDTYDFFEQHHNRDGIDDLGAPTHTTVNFGTVGNAFFVAIPQLEIFDIIFGPGFATDDIVGHEFTHGVTFFTSDLIYAFESGAINESFSDIWGEFVDLTNGRGNDSADVRWLIGEDAPGGAIRSMADPTLFFNPDRYNSPLFFTDPFFDNGGVHFNSGIGNKLAFLLVEGQTFNGFEVSPLEPDLEAAIITTAKLFYETQFILSQGANYFELHSAMAQAATILADDPEVQFTEEQRANLIRALRAVEIEPPTQPGQLTEIRALPARAADGSQTIIVQWRPPGAAGFEITDIVRKRGSFPTSPTDGSQLDPRDAIPGANGTFAVIDGLPDSLLSGDGTLENDREYFYTVFWESDISFPGMSFVRARTGQDPPSLQTEAFGLSNPIDLRFAQLLFSPIVDSEAAAASGQPQDYVDYTNYTVSITENVPDFPVRRLDENGGAISVPLAEDGIVTYPLQSGRVFPYFGQLRTSFRIAANGYLDFAGFSPADPLNFPSLSNHFTVPRISAMFANLANSGGGSIWVKEIDDRVVVTYDGLPEQRVTFPFPVTTNSAQIELFFSGHIRITYKELNLSNAVVGLSDGHGFPAPIESFLPGSPTRIPTTDFTTSPANDPDTLTIWPPVPVQIGREGETITFTVRTNSPNAAARLCATWDGPQNATLPPLDPSLSCSTNRAPFSDNNDGTGTFTWRPGSTDSGVYTVTVLAETTTGESASQAVQVFVANVGFEPSATNLTLSTGEPGENPAIDRVVAVDRALMADYDYVPGSPVSEDPTQAEGETILRWFRNGAAISALTNSPGAPASITQIGEVWWFSVTPVTVAGVQGDIFTSPRVTIGLPPLIEAVTPDRVSFLGGTTIRIAGDRLSSPVSVTFNGIASTQIRSFGDEEMEVLVPAGMPGPVTLVVTTEAGSTTTRDVLTYVAPSELKARADINQDGRVNAVDVQLVVEAVLTESKTIAADMNADGRLSTTDVQIVVNVALLR